MFSFFVTFVFCSKFVEIKSCVYIYLFRHESFVFNCSFHFMDSLSKYFGNIFNIHLVIGWLTLNINILINFLLDLKLNNEENFTARDNIIEPQNRLILKIH